MENDMNLVGSTSKGSGIRRVLGVALVAGLPLGAAPGTSQAQGAAAEAGKLAW